MIFIKGKKEWKELARSIDMKDRVSAPIEYPCYMQMIQDESGFNYTSYLYLRDLQSMIDSIKKGREF